MSNKRDLLNAPKNGYARIDDKTRSAIFSFNEDYKVFIDAAKTEREAVLWTISEAEKRGFRPFVRGEALKAGDKIYRSNRSKSLILAVIGSEAPGKGFRITASHIDSPRLDLKMNPLFEDNELAYFKTHYYGGIKKFHWVNIPLELRGVVALKDGSVTNVVYGADPVDPALVITDILIHLSAEQMKKTMADGITGEGLNALVGSIPAAGEDGDNRVKLAVMCILNDKYGITEADLVSAELSLVPSFNSRDVGFDRSVVGAYGHDDRVCAFDDSRALFDLNKIPARTAVCVLADKEEIGSMGVSGMQSAFFDTFCEDICDAYGVPLRVCYESSFCLSNDVAAAYDPNWPQPFEKRNTALLNYGIGITKYTGRGGKSGGSDASAELIAHLRKLFDDAGVVWQVALLGAVDAGGGGTVAQFMANRNIDTVDCGVPVLSMHSPWELVSKFDNYMTYAGVKAFYSEK